MAVYSSSTHLPLEKSIVPEVDINIPKKYEFPVGVQSIRYQNQTANSVSNSSMSFSYKPSQNVIIGPKMYIKYQMLFTFTGTSSSGNNLLRIGGDDAVRFMPLQSNCTSLTAALNGCQVQLPNANMDLITALFRFQDWASMHDECSTAYSTLDVYQKYSDYVTYGSNMNVLGNFGEGQLFTPRGSSLSYNVLTNTTTSATVKVTITEPLCLSPFVWGKVRAQGFALLQSIEVNLSYNLNRCWSHSTANGTLITAQAVAISSSGGADFDPQLLFTELTPDNTLIRSAPLYDKQYSLPWENLQVYNYDYGSSVTSGSSATVTTNAIQFTQVPRAVLIWVKQRLSDQQTLTSPSYFATNYGNTAFGITNISVSIGGSANYLSEATPEQLYQISAKNGLKHSWQQYRYYTGSYLLLKFGEDIPLDPSNPVGSASTLNFQVTNIGVVNLSDVTMSPTVMVVPVFDGVFQGQMNTATLYNGVMSTSEGLLAPIGKPNPMKQLTLWGGRVGRGWFSDLADSISSVVSPVVKVAKDVIPAAKMGIDLYNAVKGKGKAKAKPKLKTVTRKGRGISYGGQIDYEDNVGYMDQDELDQNIYS